MKITDVMVRDVVTIDATANLLEAANRMREENVGILPVMDGDQMMGVITDRDIVVRGLARNLDPTSVKVEECASSQPLCARESWDTDKALQMMAEHQVGRLPVVDDEDHVVGMVSLSSVALRADEDEDTIETAKQVSRRSART
jgi:CBS domain-containing protein